MKDLFFLLVFVFMLAFPVAATTVVEDDVNGDVTVSTTAPSVDPSDPSDETSVSESSGAVVSDETGIAAMSISGDLAGGYYFVCDCALGSGIKFYVPFDWASEVFTFDSSGAPVNLSNSTCYAWSPHFPDYTFSCSRFGTFTYRADNYSTQDLNITNITESNIIFLEDEAPKLSDSDLLVLIAGMVFLFGIGAMIFRR